MPSSTVFTYQKSNGDTLKSYNYSYTESITNQGFIPDDVDAEQVNHEKLEKIYSIDTTYRLRILIDAYLNENSIKNDWILYTLQRPLESDSIFSRQIGGTLWEEVDIGEINSDSIVLNDSTYYDVYHDYSSGLRLYATKNDGIVGFIHNTDTFNLINNE